MQGYFFDGGMAAASSNAAAGGAATLSDAAAGGAADASGADVEGERMMTKTPIKTGEIETIILFYKEN